MARNPSLLPLLLCIALLLALQLLHSHVIDLAFERGAIISGEWWRLLSGQWVHNNWAHLGMNTLALTILWWLLGEDSSPAQYGATLLLLSLLTASALYWFEPELSYYLGLSGVLHGLAVVGSIMAIHRGNKLMWLLLASVLAKILYEQCSGADEATAQTIQIRVATEAHLWGAVSGALLAIALSIKTALAK